MLTCIKIGIPCSIKSHSSANLLVVTKFFSLLVYLIDIFITNKFLLNLFFLIIPCLMEIFFFFLKKDKQFRSKGMLIYPFNFTHLKF